MSAVLERTREVDRRAEPRPVTVRALVAVETRKLVDTRASVWIQVVVLVLCLAVTIAAFALPVDSRTQHVFVGYSGAVVSILLPMVAILALTSEWANGSILTPAVLVPRRWQILAAKFVALFLFATAWTALCLAIGTVATVAGGPEARDAAWDMGAGDVATFWIGIVLSTTMGAAFGAAFMNPAIAIVVYLVLPLAWSIVSQLVEVVGDLSRWLDSSVTFSHLLDGTMDEATDWWEVAASTGVWIALPLVVGLVRLSRREVS